MLRGQSLQDMILRSLQEELVGAGVFSPAELNASQFLVTLATTLTAAGAELILLVDGINEHRDLVLVDDCILGLMRQWNRLPIKLVVTCRDIFWSFFSEERWRPFLFRNRIFELPSFAPERMEELISSYFEAFQITGQLLGSAREKCRHPLLLRFFCESHRGSEVHAVMELRLKDLFDEYWQRKRQDIAQSIGPETGTIAVEEFLLKIVNHMATAEVTNIPLSEVRRITAEADVESNRSIYKRLLDQDIIIEELPPEQAMDRSYTARRISFVYDEFFDYMMALAHVRRAGWDALDPRQIRDDFAQLVRDSKRFEQLRGVAEYLVLIAEQRQLQKELCTELASQGAYEILCNVLPKLRGERSWMLHAKDLVSITAGSGGPFAGACRRIARSGCPSRHGRSIRPATEYSAKSLAVPFGGLPASARSDPPPDTADSSPPERPFVQGSNSSTQAEPALMHIWGGGGRGTHARGHGGDGSSGGGAASGR